jgi:preprotein translocase subunit YajC
MLSLFALLGTAAAQSTAGEVPQPNFLIQIFPFLLIMVVFYFLIMRPQQQARKKHQAMIEGVKRGDTVVTAGGLVGKVVRVSDGIEITVKIAEGVEVQVVKASLGDVRTKGEPAAATTDAPKS